MSCASRRATWRRSVGGRPTLAASSPSTGSAPADRCGAPAVGSRSGWTRPSRTSSTPAPTPDASTDGSTTRSSPRTSASTSSAGPTASRHGRPRTTCSPEASTASPSGACSPGSRCSTAARMHRRSRSSAWSTSSGTGLRALGRPVADGPPRLARRHRGASGGVPRHARRCPCPCARRDLTLSPRRGRPPMRAQHARRGAALRSPRTQRRTPASGPASATPPRRRRAAGRCEGSRGP